MAAKKKVTTTTTEIDNENENNGTGFTLRGKQPSAQYEFNTDDPLADLDARFPQANRKFKVGRVTPNGVRHVFSTNDINSLDEDFLQEHHGGGRFVVRVFVDNVQVRDAFEIDVEDRPGTQPRTPIDNTKQNANPGTQNGNGNGAFGSLTEMLLMKLLDRAPAATSTSVSELAEVMRIAKDNAGGGTVQVNGKEYMEGFKAGVEFATKFSDRANGTTDWKTALIDGAKEALPLVAQAIGGAGSRVPATAPRAANPINVPQPPVVPVKETVMRDADSQLVFDTIQNLKSYAMTNTDPDLIVDWALANSQKVEVQSVIRFAFANDFAAFTNIDPEIKNEPFATWFKLVYDGLRSSFKPDDSMDDDNDGESGDTRNVTPNANARGA